MPKPASPRRGFTLIELMVVVAIVAILAAIALPSYRSYVLKSRRSDGKTALLDLASREERFFTVNNQYTTVATSLGYATAFPVPVATGGQSYYQLDVPNASSSGYTATATPINDQTGDGCGTYSITSLGLQGNTGTATGCW